MKPFLGVLGGMGPAATADFMRLLTESTEASRDQDHIPAIVLNIPQIPDRSEAMLGTGPSPLPDLLEKTRFLVLSGAKIIAMPCNSAHKWHDELQKTAEDIPFLHIVDAVKDVLVEQGITSGPVGLLSTAGTRLAGIYPNRLKDSLKDVEIILPTEEEINNYIQPGIWAIKAGDTNKAIELMTVAAKNLLKRGVRKIILGCTEVPLAVDWKDLAMVPYYIDSTRALARLCVRKWNEP